MAKLDVSNAKKIKNGCVVCPNCDSWEENASDVVDGLHRCESCDQVYMITHSLLTVTREKSEVEILREEMEVLRSRIRKLEKQLGI